MLDQAPRCELVFAPEADAPPENAMRSDAIDLYLGATTSLAPEIRRQMFQVVKTVFTTRSPDDLSSAPGA